MVDILDIDYYSPAMKKWGYIGLAMSFSHSEIPELCFLVGFHIYVLGFHIYVHILFNTLNVSGQTYIHETYTTLSP